VLPHSIPRRTHWGNPYHLLCASPSGSSYSPAGALPLGKPLLFTMCFPGGRIAIGETPIIYYVLLHPILRRARFSLKTRMGPTPSYWGNPYHLLCASPSYSSIFFENTHGPNPLLLGKPLSFTMCFPIGFILFPGGRIVIGETPIIYYVLLHPILRRARFSLKTRMGPTPSYWGNPYYLLCASPSYSPADSIFFENTVTGSTRSYWGNPYHLLCASPSCSPTSALPLGKPLLFSDCFPSYRCSRLGTDPDRGRCQAIPRDIGETSII